MIHVGKLERWKSTATYLKDALGRGAWPPQPPSSRLHPRPEPRANLEQLVDKSGRIKERLPPFWVPAPPLGLSVATVATTDPVHQIQLSLSQQTPLGGKGHLDTLLYKTL